MNEGQPTSPSQKEASETVRLKFDLFDLAKQFDLDQPPYDAILIQQDMVQDRRVQGWVGASDIYTRMRRENLGRGGDNNLLNFWQAYEQHCYEKLVQDVVRRSEYLNGGDLKRIEEYENDLWLVYFNSTHPDANRPKELIDQIVPLRIQSLVRQGRNDEAITVAGKYGYTGEKIEQLKKQIQQQKLLYSPVGVFFKKYLKNLLQNNNNQK